MSRDSESWCAGSESVGESLVSREGPKSPELAEGEGATLSDIAKRGTAKQLRVVTLNLASFFERDWETRRFETLAWFERLDADIVCLQEVWETPGGDDNTAKWLVDNDTNHDWHWAFGGCSFTTRGGREVEFGSAILSRWPISTHQKWTLPVDGSAKVPSPVYRMALELLHVRTNGIDVFSTHLAPPPSQAYHRVVQAMFIDEQIKANADPAAVIPPILCGDFNAEPLSDEIRFLSSLATIDGTSTYYQDAWRAAGNTEPGFTWDHRTNAMARDMLLPPKRLDYIFVGDPFGRADGAGLVEACNLAFHEPITGIDASDHYGVVADIRWTQREALEGG